MEKKLLRIEKKFFFGFALSRLTSKVKSHNASFQVFVVFLVDLSRWFFCKS